MIKKIFAIFVIMLVLTDTLPIVKVMSATQATYYISPVGNDTTGNGSINNPWKTITKVRDVVRTINSNMTGDIYIYLRGGTYTLSNSIDLNLSDSGTNGYNVIYKAYTDEIPIISGGVQINGWTLHDSGKNIYKAQVGSLEFRQLYVNEKRAIRSRTPNLTNETTNEGYNTMIQGLAYPFTINASEISNWQNFSQVEMVWLAHWHQKYARLQSYTVNGSQATVYFQDPEASYTYRLNHVNLNNARYYFENAYEFIDTEGEWYLDKQNDMLYYKPRSGEDMSTAVVMAPSVQTLVRFEGTETEPVHNIQFYGISFKYSNWLLPDNYGYLTQQAARKLETADPTPEPNKGEVVPGMVQIKNASNIKLERNIFKFSGAHGIVTLAPVDHINIVGNVISDMSAGGIWMDPTTSNQYPSPDDPRDQYSVVINNLVELFGRYYTEAAGITAGRVANMAIKHNEVRKGGYSGISIGWTWFDMDQGSYDCDVSYNKITEVSRIHDDGAGIYSLGRMDNSNFHHNYIGYLTTPTFSGTWPIYGNAGIYLDNGSYKKTVEYNVIDICGSAFHTNSSSSVNADPAHNNMIRGNYYNCTATWDSTINTVYSNTLVTSNNWPQEARDIIGSAGIEKAYRDILGTNLALHSAAFMLNGAPAVNKSAYYAVDADDNTFSQSDSDVPWDLKVDLGDGYTFNKVIYKPSPNNYATQYSIKVSTDNVNWTTVFTEAAGDGTIKTHTFEPVYARYILMDVAAESGGGPGYGHAIYSLKVYNDSGTILPTPSPTPAQTPPPMPTPEPDPVSQWSFEQSAKDFVGSNNGLLINSPSFSTDKKDGKYSLVLNGVNQYAEIEDSSTLDIGTGDFSIALWFKRNSSTSTNLRLISKEEGANRKGYAIWGSDSSISVAVGDGNSRKIITGNHTGVDKWNHIVMNVDRDGYLKLYINGGSPVGTVSIADWDGLDIGTASNLMLGRDAAYDQLYWKGKVDNVRIYNRVLTQQEIDELAGISGSLVNDNFDSDTTGTAPSGWVTDTSSGYVQVAENPNSTDKSMKLYDNDITKSENAYKSFVSQSGAVIAELDVRVERTDKYIHVCYLNDTAGTNAISIVAGVNGYFQYMNSDQQFVNIQTYNPGTWYHFKIVADPVMDRMDLYIDDMVTPKENQGTFRNSVNDISIIRIGAGTYDIDATGYWNNIQVYELLE